MLTGKSVSDQPRNLVDFGLDFRGVLWVLGIVIRMALWCWAVEGRHGVPKGSHGRQGFLGPRVLGSFLDHELIGRCGWFCLPGNLVHLARVFCEFGWCPPGLDEATKGLTLVDGAEIFSDLLVVRRQACATR